MKVKADPDLANLLEPPKALLLTEFAISQELLRRGLEWAIEYSTEELPKAHRGQRVDPASEPDDVLMLAIQILHHAELQLPEILNRIVALAITRGRSWASIAESLECSRQAAQKRFSSVVTLLAERPDVLTTSHPIGRRSSRSK